VQPILRLKDDVVVAEDRMVDIAFPEILLLHKMNPECHQTCLLQEVVEVVLHMEEVAQVVDHRSPKKSDHMIRFPYI
jgi:hypothetical protein